MDIICFDCGAVITREECYRVPGDECGTKPVCSECAKKYGYNLE